MRVIVRIRTSGEQRIRPGRRPNQRIARLASTVLWPLALSCFLICAWRWAYELSWIGRFLAASGIFSHWQVWFVAGAIAQIVALRLHRYADPRYGSDPVVHAKLLGKELS